MLKIITSEVVCESKIMEKVVAIHGATEIKKLEELVNYQTLKSVRDDVISGEGSENSKRVISFLSKILEERANDKIFERFMKKEDLYWYFEPAYSDEEKIVWYDAGYDRYVEVRVGNTYSKETLQEQLDRLKLCGELVHAMKKRNAELQAKCNPEEITYEI